MDVFDNIVRDYGKVREEVESKLLPYQIGHVKTLAGALNHYGVAGDFSDTGCHAKGTNILMADGSLKKVEDMRVGDWVQGMGCDRQMVTSLHRGYGKMFEIKPLKGDSFIVNEDHILTLQYTNIPDGNGMCKYSNQLIDISVKNYLMMNHTHKHCLKLIRSEAIWDESINMPNAYFLGLYLADGNSTHGSLSISKPDKEISSYLKEFCEVEGCMLTTATNGKRCPIHYLRASKNTKRWLKSIGLFGLRGERKFIPQSYKTANRKTRIDLLSGILDGDGCLLCNCYDYISKSKQLAEDVVFVARSLGFAAYMKTVKKSCQNNFIATYFRVSISGDISKLQLKITRKIGTKRKQIKNVLRTGFKVIEREPDNFYGFSLSGNGRFLMGDFTVTHNTGKTYAFAAVARLSGMRPLIIVPKNAITNTYRVCKEMGLVPAGVINYEKVRRGNTEWGYWDEKGRSKWFNWNKDLFDMLIIDEFHCCKSMVSLNSKMAIAAKRQGIQTLFASATVASDPTEMKALGYLTNMHTLNDFYPWLFRHGCGMTQFGVKFFGKREYMQKIHQHLFTPSRDGLPPMCSRISVRDIKDQFPETWIIPKAYDADFSNKVRDAWASMRAELDELKLNKKRMGVTEHSNNKLAVQQMYLQIIELLKVPLFVDLINDHIDQGKSVAVFVNYQQTMKAILEKTKCDCFIRGDMDPAIRQRNMDDFQADRKQLIVLSAQAGGQSINLHGKRERVTIISPSYNPIQMKQVFGRVHRQGGADSHQYIVFVAGTPEDNVCNKIRGKLKQTSVLNDNDWDTDIFEEIE